MSGRTDGFGFYCLRIMNFLPIGDQIDTCNGDDKAAGQQYPFLVAFNKAVDEGEGKECKGGVQGIAQGSAQTNRKPGPPSAGKSAGYAQQS